MYRTGRKNGKNGEYYCHQTNGRGERLAGRFPRAWLDELRARVDIVSVIGARVPLKQRGRR